MLHIKTRIQALTLIALTMLVSCSHDHEHPEPAPEAAENKPTNRLAVPPEVVANLGITFTQATRGKVGSWISVPGELYVPGTHRWNLRSPARGRIAVLVPRWQKVEAGEVVAELMSPKLREAQQELFTAYSREGGAKEESEAAHARLAEGEAQLRAALDLASASLERLDHLRKLNKGANAFVVKELLESQRQHAEAGRAALEAAVRRDELRQAARGKDLLRTRAKLHVDEDLDSFSLLTGHTREELLAGEEGSEAWKTIESIVVRAPHSGTVVDVPASRGETLDEDDSLVLILDPSELRFRGWLPEGDIRSLRADAPVRVELPGGLTSISTRLLGPMPVADSTTRRVQVEATVPNPGLTLPQGLSATAHVQVKESAGEEVLLPEDCIVTDGLEMIVFLRDPKDPGYVIRTPVELGLRGAGIVEVLAGVLAGDFVARKGIYQLRQTGIGKSPRGGHFHADGIWHPKH